MLLLAALLSFLPQAVTAPAPKGKSPAAPTRDEHQRMSVADPDADHSIAAELKSFELADGYAINLFASEADGIANPIVTRWDARGRLWVLCSEVYPQIVPTNRANDKLFILEDADGDGRADKSVVFADGLNMPMGFALGDGGVYLGEGEDLLFLKDTDGDDRADSREVIFTGFGTGDTHQNINSFTWSPGGELLFCQGLHCFSRVETPWGIARLDEHGVWRMRPRRRQLHSFRGGSGQNPWGLAFGHWGEPFVKGNSPMVGELLPILVPTDHFQPPLNIGGTQIKSMIVLPVDSPQLPADLQGNLLIAGYFARMIDRLKPRVDGSGHRLENLPPLLRSSHRSFRPVDLNVGPDGAIYVADWYNPIIGHYQASFRHPDRDKLHGRIWRITAKGVPTPARPQIASLTVAQLVEKLRSTIRWERDQAKQRLSAFPTTEVVSALRRWLKGLDPAATDYEHCLFEALGVFEWHEVVEVSLLEQLLVAREPLARAYATRVVGRWHDRLEQPPRHLERAVTDASSRVRLEAVVAAGQMADATAMTVAARALEQPMDRFLTAALGQTSHALKPHWWPALTAGRLAFRDPSQLAFVLQKTAGADAAATVRGLLNGGQPLTPAVTDTLLTLLAAIGNPSDLRFVLDRSLNRPDVLLALGESARLRKVQPAGALELSLRQILDAGPDDARAAALRLAGRWQVGALAGPVGKFADNRAAPVALRVAAIESLGGLKQADAAGRLQRLAREPDAAVQVAAVEALIGLDLSLAAAAADGLLRAAGDEAAVQRLVIPFAGHTRGLAALASALRAAPVESNLATRILRVVGGAGRRSAELEAVLAGKPAAGALGIPDYSEALVRELAREVRDSGDARRGAVVYGAARLNCAGCHKIGEVGGVFGPELTAVGSGLPVELLIEAVLWPKRQVKEGFLATVINTKDGRALSGYLQSEDQGRLRLRDIATGVDQTIARGQILSREDAGTIMPDGLTAELTRAEVRDLIRYLMDLKGR